MGILNTETFTVTGTEAIDFGSGSREVGTVEARLAGQTKLVKAVRYDCGRIVSWDFNGRYRTGTKLWPATVSVDADGKEWVWFGKDHSSRHCIKNQLYFA